MHKKGEPGSVKIHGVGKSHKSSKTQEKKLKSAIKHSKDVAYSRASGKPLKGFKGLPKIVKITKTHKAK